MKTDWHQLTNLESDSTGGISADIAIGPESLWFDGHFPGFPVLPGIAQLAMVFDALRACAQRERADIALSEISRVRFRHLIRPGDAIRVTAATDGGDPSRHRFRVMAGGQLACSGIMKTIPARP
ncbi:MAG: hypothetical protein E4G96_07295 [Chrysiogenales bacterium]|nr:MAG: hypothetical protein E4G96_07295 [Chrysiogenales bacterium]